MYRRTIGLFGVGICLCSLTAPAATEDPLQALLRKQTEAFSDASMHQDQAAMDKLLDDDVLFSGGSGTVDRDPQHDKNDAISALIEKQTQAFQDAGVRGDWAAMKGYLDPNALFVGEDGTVSGAANLPAGDPAIPAESMAATVKLSDWVLHHSDSVAVSSFVTERLVHFSGQDLSYKFLSVECWVLRGSAWKLLSSQTVPLHQDPAVVSLAAKTLEEYEGSFSGAPGVVVTISRNGDALDVSLNGAKAGSYRAEARDVFFRPDTPPGYPRPRMIFQRDREGRVTGYVSCSPGAGILARTKVTAGAAAAPAAPQAANAAPTLTLRDFEVHRSGDVAVATFLHDKAGVYFGQPATTTYRSTETWVKHGEDWKMIASQGRELQPTPPAISIAPDRLAEYTGTYAVDSGLRSKVVRNGDSLGLSLDGAKVLPLVLVGQDFFAVSGDRDITVLFHRDGNGRITEFACRRAERDLVYRKG